MKAWKIALITGAAATSAVGYAAFPFDNVDTRTFGPFNCPTCQGQTPIPDDSTLAFLKRYELEQNKITNQMYNYFLPGAKIVICNGNVCTTYEKTNSNDWYAVKQEAIKSSPPRGGSGTGSGKGSGSGGSGSGTGDGRGKGGSARDDDDGKGVVTVGKPGRAKDGKK